MSNMIEGKRLIPAKLWRNQVDKQPMIYDECILYLARKAETVYDRV